MASLINENCVDVEDEIDEKGDNITGGRHPWWDLAQGRNSTDCRLLISPEPQSPTNRPPPTDPVSFSHFLSFHLFCLTQLSSRDLKLPYYTHKKTKLELLPFFAPLGSALLTQELEKLPQRRDLQEFCVLLLFGVWSCCVFVVYPVCVWVGFSVPLYLYLSLCLCT